jgi:hypothetical protein
VMQNDQRRHHRTQAVNIELSLGHETSYVRQRSAVPSKNSFGRKPSPWLRAVASGRSCESRSA